MDYITKSELEQYTGLQIDDELDTFLDLISSFAKDYIDTSCSSDVASRWFDDDADTDSTRRFDGNDAFRLYVDDLREITTVESNGIALVENTDFYAYPLNATDDGVPYEWIELVNPSNNLNVNSRIAAISGTSPFVFTRGQRNIAITGRWGYNELEDGNLPPSVKMAALKICAGIIKENIGDTDLKELTSESLGEYSASYAKVADIADRLGVPSILGDFIRTKKVIGGGNRLLS